MSSQGDLALVEKFVASLLTVLPAEIAKSNDALFPNGVNDIFLKITFGDVNVQLEISSARAIHDPCADGDRTTSGDKTIRPGK